MDLLRLLKRNRDAEQLMEEMKNTPEK